MSRSKSLLVPWLAVVVWMTVIFGASTGLMTSQRTSRFIGPVLRWFYPDISDNTVRQVQLGVRKGAHVTEYAVLALLLYHAIRRARDLPAGQWSALVAGCALAVAIVYAASDEWHQTFVAGRDGTVHDVIIDGAGAALGLLFLQRWYLSRQQRELRQQR